MPATELDFLHRRRSVPSKQLGEPAPDADAVARMLQAAVRVPDHGKLVPFRFIRIQGQARHALGERLVERVRSRDPDAPAATLEKERMRFAHAPLIITVVARLDEHAKVPVQEQLLSAGSVCFALLQAAQALGYGAQWLTAWMAYDPAVERLLGLQPGERIVGFIHIGTPRQQVTAPERERPDALALLSDWQPDA